jgi:hypothetical protein
MKGFLGLVVFLSACGAATVQNNAPTSTIDPSLDIYLKAFQAHSPQPWDITHLTLQWGTVSVSDANGDVLGNCVVTGTQQIITIYPTAENRPLTSPDGLDAQLEETVFHELGHCLLGRAHTTNTNSIMQAYDIPADQFNAGFAGYVQELFQ